MNGGFLDKITCSCICLPNFQGNDCSELTCIIDDPVGCDKNICDDANLKKFCPQTCLCNNQPSDCKPIECQNGGFFDKNSCNCLCNSGFSGNDCSLKDEVYTFFPSSTRFIQ